MARKRDRAFAMFGAILFLVTSSALTVAVVVSMVQDSHKKKDNTTAAQTQLNKAKDEPVNPANQLQGKPLAGFTPVASITQLQTTDTTPGTGTPAKASDTVTVDYTGAVASTGVIFQSSKDTGRPVSFPLNQVIEGWKQGIPGMKEGGTRRLLIPAKLAYGANPPSGSGIPANADLVFDVTLYKVGN